MERTTRHEQSKKRKSLILFDLDGVLLDSRANMAIAWQTVQCELSIATPFEAYFAEIGRPFGDIMVRLGLGGRSAEIEAVFRRASAENLADTPFYPGGPETLAQLAAANRKFGIVTSKDSTRTAMVLDRLAVTFTVVKTPDAICRGKPAPDSLLMAMAACNVDPDDTIYIGDMDSDATAAKRAKIDYIHAEWGYGNKPSTVAFAVSSFQDLAAYLRI